MKVDFKVDIFAQINQIINICYLKKINLCPINDFLLFSKSFRSCSIIFSHQLVTLRYVTLVVFTAMLRVRGAGQKHGRLHVICRAAVTLAASHSRYSSSYLPTVTTLITRLRSSF